MDVVTTFSITTKEAKTLTDGKIETAITIGMARLRLSGL